MTERAKFVLEWERQWNLGEGHVNMSALARAFGISRQTAYEWVRRYQDAGNQISALKERSRRPHSNSRAVSARVESLIVAAKQRFRFWGPRKLRPWLIERFPDESFPAVSTIGEILKRKGLVRKRRKRHRVPPHTKPFAACDAPNAVWCVDFKGDFRVGNGKRVFPLTIMDAHTRYLLRCEALERPCYAAVRRVFESVFREYGLPKAIRSDNGPPFATRSAGGLSALSVWWVRLGIRPERIEPGKPQQNGRHERMHLTLKLETAMPPSRSVAAQQRAFDDFVRYYNHERPHEALNQRPPASLYSRSTRECPRRLPRLETEPTSEIRAVDALGKIDWNNHHVFVNRALSGQAVEVAPIALHRWEVRFGPVILGQFDDRRLRGGHLIRPRRRLRKCQ